VTPQLYRVMPFFVLRNKRFQRKESNPTPKKLPEKGKGEKRREGKEGKTEH